MDPFSILESSAKPALTFDPFAILAPEAAPEPTAAPPPAAALPTTAAPPPEDPNAVARGQQLQEMVGEMNRRAGTLGADAESISEAGDTVGAVGQGIGAAIGGGAAKAVFETGDFLFGEPEEGDKTQFRRNVEQSLKEATENNALVGVGASITQFVTGMIGLGKLAAPLKGIKAIGTGIGRWAFEAGKAATVGAVAFDPHEERLSNLIQSFPSLANPVTEYLAAKPTDTAAEGRLKAALESIGLDAALGGLFVLGLKGFRALRGGDVKEAERALNEAGAGGGGGEPRPDAQPTGPGTPDETRTPNPTPREEWVPGVTYLDEITVEGDAPRGLDGEIVDDIGGAESRTPAPYPITSEEARARAETIREDDRTIVEQVFGPEEAKRYRRLERISKGRRYEEAQAASEEMAAMEDSLTPEQQARLWGTDGGALDDPRDLDDLADSLFNVEGSRKDMTDELGYRATDLPEPGKPEAEWTSRERIADAAFRAALKRIEEEGWDTAEISAEVFGKARGRFDDPADADFMLERFRPRRSEAPEAPAAEPTPEAPPRQLEGPVEDAGVVPDEASPPRTAESGRGPLKLDPDAEDVGEGFQNFTIRDADGNAVGRVEAELVDGDTVRINNIAGADETSNRFGPAGMRSLLRQLQEFYPSAKRITGIRSSGARDAAGGRGEATVEFGPAPETSAAPERIEVVQNATEAQAADGVGPAPRRGVEVADEEVDAILDAAERDAEAIARFGTREDAEAAGHKFGQSTLDMPESKFVGPEEVNAFRLRLTAALEARLQALKGGDVLSDERLRRMVDLRARMFGEDPELILGQLQQAGKAATTMAANMEAAYLVANKLLQDAYAIARRVKAGTAPAEALKRQMALAAQVMADARAMTAAAGRTLRRHREEFAVKPEDVERLASANLDPEVLVQTILDTGGDLRKLARATDQAWQRRFLDKGSWLLVNGLLWNWPTHVVNGVTNLYMMMARPAERIIGGLVSGRPAIAQQAAREYRYTVSAIWDGFKAAYDAFIQGDSIMAPHRVDAFNVAPAAANRIAWRPVRSIADLTANAIMAAKVAVGLPTRSLGAIDELIKTMRYRAVINARSSMEAERLGLTGQAYRDHMAAAMDGAFDEGGRAIDSAALHEAETSTFQQDLLPDTTGRTVQNASAKHPTLRFILPFIKTPTNVLRYSIKMTPGLNLVQREYRQMFTGQLGPEQQAQAIGQMSLGSLFMGAAATLAAQGRITGGGPSDPKLRRELMAKGWQPYSFVWVGEDGKRQYFPYGRFDPVGMVFGMVADIADIRQNPAKYREADNAVIAVALALAKNFGNRTYLMSLNQALRAVSEPDPNLTRWSGNLAEGMLPFSSLLRSMNDDPYLREARGFLDHVLGSMPGFSRTQPPARDALGEPILVRKGLWSQEVRGDVVDRELQRIMEDTGSGLTPPSPNRNGVDLRDITLEDGTNAFDRLQDLAARPGRGRSLREGLRRVIGSKAYQRAPDGDSQTAGTKLNILGRVVADYREVAFKRLLRESQIVRDAVSQRAREARDAWRANRDNGKPAPNSAIAPTSGANPLDALLGAYGQR